MSPAVDAHVTGDTGANLREAAVYGLDIETDTTTGGLDPASSAIVAVAVTGPDFSTVLSGPEPELLRRLDRMLGDLHPGVLVTWNGARFDLPFLSDRALITGVQLGLHLVADRRTRSSRDPLPGHEGGYLGSWYGHRHLDAYGVYRADVGASLGLPCGLKPLSRLLGLEPVEVDREQIHALPPDELDRYVASDAALARELALRRWATARLAIDPMITP